MVRGCRSGTRLGPRAKGILRTTTSLFLVYLCLGRHRPPSFKTQCGCPHNSSCTYSQTTTRLHRDRSGTSLKGDGCHGRSRRLTFAQPLVLMGLSLDRIFRTAFFNTKRLRLLSAIWSPALLCSPSSFLTHGWASQCRRMFGAEVGVRLRISWSALAQYVWR